jgi:asparagine synthase (glutamine-hydrolysing)
MCGIAGAIGALNPAILNAVNVMSNAQRHRGPDDDGAWQCIDPVSGVGAAFAFRRLAIIDLSADAHQPMIDPETDNVIVFNGEIYNYRVLRDELARSGVRFRSKSDTEVILKVYSRFGVAAFEKLRGMFAFAIWDAAKRQVVLARDRIGIKPLYLCEIGGAHGKTLLFASELRSLLATNLIERRLNASALSTFVWNGFVVGPQTIVEGIRLLPAGTFECVDGAATVIKHKRYWQLAAAAKGGNPTVPRAHNGGIDHAVEELKEQLSCASQEHMISDVPLGVFLSGGIDSSAIAALAVRSAGSRVKTFNIGFDESKYDESLHARTVAQALGTDHTEVKLSQGDFQDHLFDAMSSLDQPTFDAINTFFISRAVRNAGITVALAGTGGDELFGGYRSFADLPRAQKWSRHARMVPRRMLQPLGAMVALVQYGKSGETPPQTRWGKLADGLGTRGNLVDLYQTAYSLFTGDLQRRLLDGGLDSATRSGLPYERAVDFDEMIRSEETLTSISELELSMFIGERLLRDTDAASMAVSLEVRVPLLDHRIIESALAVPEEQRFHPLGKKMLLRNLALQDIDPAVFDRPKSGFELPIDRWCRDKLRDELTETFADRELCESVGIDHVTVNQLWRAYQSHAPGLYWSRVWALFVLLWWCREHRVSRA